MPQTIPEELTKLRHIFGDETCQERHRWMVLGTTVVLDEHIQHVRAKFLAVKARMGLAGCEMKWERTNKKLLDRYKRMADVAFFLIKKGVMQFHAMLICMDVVDHEKYNEGIPDLSYSRFFHHLLMKYLRIYPAENKYYVLFDERTSTVPMRPFQDPANFAAKRDYGIDH